MPDHDTTARQDNATGPRPEVGSSLARAWSPEVIDLRGLDGLKSYPTGVRVKVDRRSSPLETMSEQARMRLFIRVLCELVAYGEPSEDRARAGSHLGAGDGAGPGSDPDGDPDLVA